MSSLYKQEEETMKKIIADLEVPVREEDQVTLNIFYKSKKLQNLFMKSNIHKPEDQTKESRVVYQYTCPKQQCQPCISYLGYTECTLIDRLRNHAQTGSTLTHSIGRHGIRLTAAAMAQSTVILRKFSTKEDLVIAEAILIKERNPKINGQREGEIRILSVL